MEAERLDRAKTVESIAAVTASSRALRASVGLVRYPPRAAGLAAGAAVCLLGAPAGGHGELLFPTVDEHAEIQDYHSTEELVTKLIEAQDNAKGRQKRR